MERQQLDEHVQTECPHTVVACKYRALGCTTDLKIKDMATHELDENLYLHMALDTVRSLQQTLKKGESMTFAMPEFKKYLYLPHSTLVQMDTTWQL